MIDPSGGQLFVDEFLGNRVFELSEGGEYRLDVYALTANVFEYSAVLTLVEAEVFGIEVGGGGFSLGPNSPEEGMGDIERPGFVDSYVFDAPAGSVLSLDLVSVGSGAALFRLIDPSGGQLFVDEFLGNRVFELSEGGEYRLDVYALTANVFEYSAVLTLVEAEVFGIEVGGGGFSLGPNSPEEGMGDIERPGFVDSYVFDAPAGSVLSLDLVSVGSGAALFRLIDPSGGQLFVDEFLGDRVFELSEGGEYRLDVYALTANVFEYSAVLTLVEAEVFGIDVGGGGFSLGPNSPVEGMGDIERPGFVDSYVFDAPAGSVLSLDLVSVGSGAARFRLIDPSGDPLAEDESLGNRVFELSEGGEYRLDVYALTANAFEYSLVLAAAS